VFAGSIRTVPAYEEVVQVLGGIWGIAETEVDAFFIHSGADVNAFFSQPSAGGSALDAAKNTIQRGEGLVRIGRATISTTPSAAKPTAIGQGEEQSHQREQNFAMTKYSLRLLERVAVCVSRNEPVLLVGETGTGKTTSVQELADILGKRLTVQNLSLSTDVSDLLGGYRPVTMKQLFLPMYEIFVRLFNDTLSSSQNTEFLQIVARFYQAQSWKRLLKAFLKASDQATKKLSKSLSVAMSKNESGAANLESAIEQWASFRAKIARYEANLPKIEFGFAFQFVDGLLVDALRNGDWVLLDEINLASA
jgi:midasin (ATPase involved in ribosome maturation)